MTIHLTIRIEAGTAYDDPPCSWIAADELVGSLGGKMVGWQPETKDGPAKATFAFANEKERDEFIVAARHVPRVML